MSQIIYIVFDEKEVDRSKDMTLFNSLKDAQDYAAVTFSSLCDFEIEKKEVY